MPLRSASLNTTTTGRIRKTAKNRTAKAINSNLTGAVSVVTGRGDLDAEATSAIAMPPPAGSLNQVDRKQNKERQSEHDDSDRGGAAIIEFLQFDDNEHWGDLGHVRQIAGDEDHRTVLAYGAREGERKTGQQRRRERRENDVTNSLPPACAKRR